MYHITINDCGIDNRDVNETWLQLPDGTVLELMKKDLEDLLRSMNENNRYPDPEFRQNDEGNWECKYEVTLKDSGTLIFQSEEECGRFIKEGPKNYFLETLHEEALSEEDIEVWYD